MILPKGSSAEGSVGGLYCACVCVYTSRTEPQLRYRSCVYSSFVASNQVHMYHYSMNATVAVFVPISLCVFVPVINTGVYQVMEVEIKYRGQGASLTLRSRWRACAWRPSRCRAGCAGHDAAG